MAIIDFKTTDYEQPAMGPVPTGEYTVIIDASELRPTKAGDGQYLALEMSIVDGGEFKGRKIFDNLNIYNPNKTAQDIGRGALNAIATAVGVSDPGDSSELHNKPLNIIVVIDPASNGYSERNRVKKYKSCRD